MVYSADGNNNGNLNSDCSANYYNYTEDAI